MKSRNTVLYVALLLFFSLGTSYASVTYEVQAVQTVIAGPKLQVDFQIKNTGDDFVLGTVLSSQILTHRDSVLTRRWPEFPPMTDLGVVKMMMIMAIQ